MIYTKTLNLSTGSCKLSEILIKFEVKDIVHGITPVTIIVNNIFQDLCSKLYFYERFFLTVILDVRIICDLM